MTTRSTAVKIDAAYGRLYVSGPGHKLLYKLPGGAYNEKRVAVELSLTLDTLRRIKQELRVGSAELARMCTPGVLAWAKAAGASERRVAELHQRLEAGYRRELPWRDAGDAQTGAYRPPYDHQRIMATVACELDGCAFLCEVGTGKTRAAVEALRYWLDVGRLDVVFVVCPKKVIKTWKNELAQWRLDVPWTVLDGTVKARQAFLREWRRDALSPRVVLLNYDVLYLLEDDLLRLFGRVRAGLLPDEMHRIKNPQAKVSKALMRLAQASVWRLGLTGTPVLQGLQDVWSQWYVVDLGITLGANFAQYKREFLEEDTWDGRLSAKPGMLEEVGNRMRRRGLRYRKQDCMDLPPQVYEVETAEMTAEQKRAYRDMENQLIARLSEQDPDDVVTAANQLVMILRLTQITSGFVPNEQGVVHRLTPNPKLDLLEELVEEHLAEHQILVWARYTEDVASICQRLAHHRPVVIVGDQAIPRVKARGVDVPPVELAQDWFQRGERRLLVANPAAGGEGLNLQASDLALYYSQGYSLKDRLQSEGRNHRGGSEKFQSVTYIDLVMEGTVDEVVRGALAGKKSVAEAVVDLRRHLGLAA